MKKFTPYFIVQTAICTLVPCIVLGIIGQKVAGAILSGGPNAATTIAYPYTLVLHTLYAVIFAVSAIITQKSLSKKRLEVPEKPMAAYAIAAGVLLAVSIVFSIIGLQTNVDQVVMQRLSTDQIFTLLSQYAAKNITITDQQEILAKFVADIQNSFKISTIIAKVIQAVIAAGTVVFLNKKHSELF